MDTGGDAYEDPTANRRSGLSPDEVRSYRYQLTPGEDVIDPATWAGSVPQVSGLAPRVRVGRDKWFNLLWLLPIGFLAADHPGGDRQGADAPTRRDASAR